MQREQIATGSVDLTWIFTQSLFMALNTVLWSLSYPEIRKEHSIEEVRRHLDIALDGIVLAAKRWPGVESAFLLYKNLVTACLKAYNTDESFVVQSPSNHATPTSSQDVTSPPSISSPASTTTSFQSHNARAGKCSNPDSLSSGNLSRGPSAEPAYSFTQASPASSTTVESFKAPQYTTMWEPQLQHPPAPAPAPPLPPSSTATPTPYTTPPYSEPVAPYSEVQFDPATPHNPFPTVIPRVQGWDPNFTLGSTTPGHLAYVEAQVDPMDWMDIIGNQYSQYFNGAYPTPSWRGRTLSQQEQIELMASLEQNIPDVSAQLMRETGTFYQT